MDTKNQLMNKLSALCEFHTGQSRALTIFKAIQQQFITYWNSLYPQNNMQEQILELSKIMQIAFCFMWTLDKFVCYHVFGCSLLNMYI